MLVFRLLISGLLLASASQVAAQSCAAPGPASALGEKLAGLALKEYGEFNGNRIDAQGRLWKFGSSESETERLLDAGTGLVDDAQVDRYAWRRVWRYWETLDQHVPGTLQNRRVTWAKGLLDDPAQAGPARTANLKQAFADLPDKPETKELLREALARTMIVDTPWSAAFISYLMHGAGLPDSTFRYSSAHAVYIRPALEDAPGYAFRACDPRRTRPRVGDLLCYSRGRTALRNLQDWRDHADELDGGIQSHCDVVVSVDAAASKIESIGGNVLQSVTRRRLMLNGRSVLSDRHQADLHPPRPGSDCAMDKTCHRGDLNLQRWGVLLQLR